MAAHRAGMKWRSCRTRRSGRGRAGSRRPAGDGRCAGGGDRGGRVSRAPAPSPPICAARPAAGRWRRGGRWAFAGKRWRCCRACSGAGSAVGWRGVLRGVGRLAARGLLPSLPADALAGAGLSMEAVIADPRAAAPLMRAMAEEGAARLAEARAEARRMLPFAAAVAAALPAVLAAGDPRRAGDPLVVPGPRGPARPLALSVIHGRIAWAVYERLSHCACE